MFLDFQSNSKNIYLFVLNNKTGYNHDYRQLDNKKGKILPYGGFPAEEETDYKLCIGGVKKGYMPQ